MEFEQYNINELRTAVGITRVFFFNEVQNSPHGCLTDGGEYTCHGTD